MWIIYDKNEVVKNCQYSERVTSPLKIAQLNRSGKYRNAERQQMDLKPNVSKNVLIDSPIRTRICEDFIASY